MNSLDPWRLIALDAYGEVVWPRPRYGHPFYQEIPSWLHYGGDDSTTRQLFDGVFIGADYAGAAMNSTEPRKGITFKKELDDRQVLHVEICVDGKCYRTQMDLAPAIAMIMTKFAQAHADLHRATGCAPPGGDVVVPAIDRAVSVAGDALIGALVDRHMRVEGFFDDIGHALSGAANAVGGVLKSLKGPVSVAAGAAATAYGGPAAGPIAAQLTGALIDAAPGGGAPPAQQAAAQQTVAAAKQSAKTNPTVQTALDAANHATSQTTAAALGHPAVPATRDSLSAIVQKFLPLATQAMSARGGGGGGGGGAALPSDLQGALAAFSSMLGGGGGGGAAVSGYPSYAVVGSFWDSVKDAVLTVTGTKATNQFIKDNHLEPYVKLASQAVATYYGGPAAGAAAGAISPMVMSLGVEDKQKAEAAHADVQGVKAVAQQAGPQMAQAADLAHGAIEHTATAYHVAQIVKDAKAGVPQAQQALSNLRAAAHSGDRNARRALHAARMLDRAQQAAPGGPGGPGPAPGSGGPPGGPGGPGGPPVGTWYDIAETVVGCVACETATAWHDVVGAAIGAAVDDLRERARAYAVPKAGNAAGVIQTADNRFTARGFRSLDDAIDWLQRSTARRADFIYAAAYEKGNDGSAYIQAEEFGGAQAPSPGGVPASAGALW